MGLLSSIFETRSNNIKLTAGDAAIAEYFGASSNSASNQIVTPETSLAVSAVLACVSRISKTLAMIPLNTMQKLPGGGHQIATKHRLYRQLSSRPNRWQTSYDWRLMGQSHVLLRGNFYNKIVFNPGRGLNELIPLHPDHVCPFIVTPSGSTHYIYDNSAPPPEGSKLFYQHFPLSGNTEVLGAEEVFHVKGLSANGIVGLNVVRLMREGIGLAMATEEQGARLFSNGAQPGKVVTHPGKLGDDAYNRMKKDFNEKYTGVQNSHRIVFLEEGMTMASIGLTMEDAQFLETRKFQVEEICSSLDVPMILIHRSGDKNSTFASAEAVIQMFVTHNMQPHFVNWEQRMAEDLLYDSERNEYYFDFDVRAMMRGDSAARAAYLKARFDMGSMTPDHVRLYEGESPMNTEESKKAYLASGVMPADMAGKTPFKPSTDKGATK